MFPIVLDEVPMAYKDIDEVMADQRDLVERGLTIAAARGRGYDGTHTRGPVLSAEDRFEIEALHKAWLDAELRSDSSAL